METVDMLVPQDSILALVVVLLGASGTYLLLPHRHGTAKPASVHVAGGVLAALALVFFALFWKTPSSPLAAFFMYAFGLSAVAGGVLTITTKNPIYSALWFAVVVLSTSGLFMLAGAQFLAAGTVIVYAGAIIVTFLFVIMLAQMEGRAPYDRAARAPGRATFSCYVLLWGLLYALLVVRTAPTDTVADPVDRRLPRLENLAHDYQLNETHESLRVVRLSTRDTLRLRVDGSADQFKPHMAGLGQSLYTDHLISVEVAGTLLFVALIGALAIASPRAPVRPGDRGPETLSNA